MKSIKEQCDDLERRLGKGATFSPGDRRLILEGVVPARVLLGARVLKGEARATYQKAYERLVELEKENGAAIDRAAFGLETAE